MTTAYTSLLGLALPVTGELSGTWGDTVNTAITSLLDTAVAGTTSITTDADITLTTTTGASNQARQAIILWNPASGTTTRNITAPAQSKMYTVINASGGTQSIVIRGVGPTTGVTIAKGESAMVAWNGSDFVKVSSSGGAITFTDLTVTGNTILGDAAADTLTVNATSTFASPVNFQGLVKLPSTGRSAAAALTVTAPAFLYGVASTYTDTTSSGTIAAMAPFYGIAAPTLSTSNVTTYSYASTLYIGGAPAAGGSATITNPYALYVNSGASYLAGAVSLGSTLGVTGATTLSNTLGVTGVTTLNNNLLFGTDATYDIGASGANRARNLYLSGFALAPVFRVTGSVSASGAGIWGNDSTLAFNASSAEVFRAVTAGVSIGTTNTNGKLTVYGGTAGGTATTLTPIETIWLDYAAAIGDNRGSGPSFVFSSGNLPSGLGKSAAIGAPSEDNGGLSRVVALSFWTSAFDADRAEVGRFTGNYGNFLVGNTTAYSTEANTVQAKGGFIWAANNTASADNRNWRAVANATVNGALEFWQSGSNTGYPNDVAVMSMLRSAVTFPRSDVVISNSTGTTNFFRAIEVGAAGNNAGFSMGTSGGKGSIYGASGLSGIRIVGGNPGLIQFGYSTGDTSVYANYNSLGTWSTTGLGVGTSNPNSKLHTVSSGLGDRGGLQIENNGAGGSSFFIWPTATVNGEGANKLIIGGDVGNIMAIFGATGQVLMGVTAAPATAPAGIFVSKNSASYGVIGARNGSGRNTFSVIGDSNFDAGYVGTSSATGTDALLEVNGTNGVRFTVSTSERGRFVGNEFMVGTTSSSGDIGNDIGSITGRTKTAYGTIAGSSSGAFQTIFTISNPGLYIVHAYIGGYVAGPGNWSNAFFVSYTGANPCYVWNLSGAGVGPVDLRRDPASNVAIQLYTSAGSGVTYTWVVQRIG